MVVGVQINLKKLKIKGFTKKIIVDKKKMI